MRSRRDTNRSTLTPFVIKDHDSVCYQHYQNNPGGTCPSYSDSQLLFFFNDTATPEIYPLSLHDALPISRPLGVPQELVTEAPALRRSRDEARQVGDHERALVVHADDAERWRERREGVVGDLGLGRRHPRHEGGLAGVGEPDDADVGEELELEVKPPLRAGPSEVSAPRRPVGRGREACVAPPTPRTADGEDPLAGRGQVPEALAGVAVGDDGAEGDPEDEITAARAVTVRPLAVLAALGVVVALVVVVEERGQRGIGFEPDAAAVAAVAAVGAAAGNVLLTAEADTAGAPIAALDENIDLVDEHTHPRGPGGGPPAVTRAPV